MGIFSRLGLAALLLLALPAHAALYAPGETLDPACAPLDVDCGVSSVVGTGVQGQVPYYAANGGILSATSSISILANGDVSLAQALIVGDAAGTRANLGLSYASSEDLADTFNIAAWGDSLTAGSGGTPYPTLLQNTSGFNFYNGGVGGESSTQIAARMIADTAKHSWPTIIWAGRNNWTSSTTIKADIASMVSALGHDNYLVISITTDSSQVAGSGGHTTIIQLNEDLADIYGDHFIDMQSYLVSQYNPGISQDVIDHANDVIPSSLRADDTHLNTNGYSLVAQRIYQDIEILSTFSNVRLITNNTLMDYLAAPPIIGSMTPNKGYFSVLGIGTTTPTKSLVLQVANTANLTNGLVISRTGGTDDLGFVMKSTAGGVYRGAITYALSGAETEVMTFEAGTGKVGIGTTTPSGRLAIAANSITPSLVIGNASSTRLILDQNGWFGLGTTSPSSHFAVTGHGYFTGGLGIGVLSTTTGTLRTSGSASIGGSIGVNGGTFAQKIGTLVANGANVNDGIIISRSGGSNDDFGVRLKSDSGGSYRGAITYATGGSEVEVMTFGRGASNYIGIATTSPWRKFSVSGTVAMNGLTSAVGTGSLCLSAAGEVVYNASDNCLSSTRETKPAIDSLALSELEMLQELRPVSFIYNGDATERLRYGFIADEADSVDPHLATRNAEGNLTGLDTSAFLALIVGAVQELSEKVTGFADSFSSKRGTFETLCVGNTCITESQLQEFLRTSAQQPVSPPPGAPAPAPDEPAKTLDAPSESEVPVTPPVEPVVAPEAPLPATEPVI